VATEIEPGTWSADIFDATPPVLFTLPDNPGPTFDRLLSIPARNVLTTFDQLEHPGAVASPLTDTIAVNATLDTPVVAGETFQLFVVGTWTARTLDAQVAGSGTLVQPAFTIDTMSNLTGRPHEKITIDDTVLVLRRVGNAITGVIEASPFEQTGADTIVGAMVAAPQDQTLMATIDQPGAAAKLGVVRPAIGAPAFSFTIQAAPGVDAGIASGPLLQAGGPAMATDTTLAATYSNPFATKGWTSVLTYTAAGSRSLTPAGETLPVALNAVMQQTVAEPAAGIALDFPVSVPEQVSIGGVSLSLDNVELPLPAAPIDVTMVVNTANVTLYSLDVRELVPNEGATALVAVRKLTATNVEPTFTLQPSVFEAGKLYSLRVSTISGGFPNVADGDLNAREFPIATASVDVGVFRVVP
jgi:hypothetical protein